LEEVSDGLVVLGFGDDIEIGLSVLGVDIGIGRSELRLVVIVGLTLEEGSDCLDVLGFADDIEIGFSVLGVEVGTGRSELILVVIVGLTLDTVCDGLDVLGLGDDIEIGFSVLGVEVGIGCFELGSVDLGNFSEVVTGTVSGLIVLGSGVGLTTIDVRVSGLGVVSGLREVTGLVSGDIGGCVLFSGLDFGTFSEVVTGVGTGLSVLGLTGVGLGDSVPGGFGL